MGLFRTNTISISRIIQAPIIGDGPETDLQETIIFTGVKAGIQYKSTTAKPRAKLPGDVDVGIFWEIFFKLPSESVKVRDIIIDNFGKRYQVVYPYFTFFQYQCLCKLEQM